MRRGPSWIVIVAALGMSGCFYLGPADPCQDDPGVPGNLDIVGCEPEGSLVVVTRRDQVILFRCEVTGAQSTTWTLTGEGAESRVIADGLPYVELPGELLAGIPGSAGERWSLNVEVIDADGLSSEKRAWYLRFLEATP